MHGGVHDAPFELALIVRYAPPRWPPGSPDAQLPAYDLAVLAGILAAHGHTDALLLPPWDMGSLPKSIVAPTYVPPPVRDLAVSWSHPNTKDKTIEYPSRPPLRDLLYPPCTPPRLRDRRHPRIRRLPPSWPRRHPVFTNMPSSTQRNFPSTHAPPRSSLSYTLGFDRTGLLNWGRRRWG
ncbi:hypothetical protein FIBSPDRAFT_249924 [Athelia psychrophila]|uniref:Uncharacterized protein n=1 Tax=Athelia psychrophila TaxID=1759441 RepID=A0A165XWG4_9AGAM|nr:hypothetical protein FIBSPDRAFT_249924 [Fibularhizoctonia sp. CBS 109695]